MVLASFDLPPDLSRADAAERIRSGFASLLREMPPPGTLIVAGGETLYAVCEALGATRLEVTGRIVPGLPRSILHGGRWDGVDVISKSGAFGARELWRDLLLDKDNFVTSRHLAITMGDPAGIGPEIIVKAAERLRARIATGDLRLLIIGSGAALDEARAAFTAGLAIPTVTADDRDWPKLCYLQADPEGDPIKPGVLSADGGRFAYKAIEQGVRSARTVESAASSRRR